MIKPLLQGEALFESIEENWGKPAELNVWWLGQSGYLIQNEFLRALIDPYLSDSLTEKYAATDKPHVRISERVISPSRLEKISIITCSHVHTDHLDAETLQPIRKVDSGRLDPWDPLFIVPRAIQSLAEKRWGQHVHVAMSDGESRQWGRFRISAVASAHDQLERDVHGDCLYLGYVFQIGRWTLYHSGDTIVYPGMVETLRPFNIDVAILPINGKVGNMGGRDAARLAKDIGARLVIPCHYDMFEFNTADPNEEFVPECERIGQPYRVLKLGERFSSSEIP